MKLPEIKKPDLKSIKLPEFKKPDLKSIKLPEFKKPDLKSIKLPEFKKLNIKLPQLNFSIDEEQSRKVWAGEIAFGLIVSFASILIGFAG